MMSFSRCVGFLCGVLLVTGAAGAGPRAEPPSGVTPGVPGFGAILPQPQAAYQPRPD